MYILLCANGAYYTGSTDKPLEARVWEHNQGIGANFTRKHRPVTVAYAVWTDRVDDAYYLEKRVHGWSRAKKEALIRGEFDRLPSLSRNAKRRAEESE
ncbi:GIY-YIG nuclease family protein [Rathayibacter sp. YIM 133350]|uniref:GIY-YIG nuclease family protein n=1 Tax=Rathayibacter sp. YIM 133350 TaxID=3131992 RepID=UPI00307EB4B9